MNSNGKKDVRFIRNVMRKKKKLDLIRNVMRDHFKSMK